MISIRKDKTQTINIELVDEDWYIISNPELEYKINRGFPNIDFILDENDNVTDITYTVQPPLTQAEKIEQLEEENQMLTDCILEMSEILYGGEEE